MRKCKSYKIVGNIEENQDQIVGHVPEWDAESAVYRQVPVYSKRGEFANTHYWDQIYNYILDGDTMVLWNPCGVEPDNFGPDSYGADGSCELVALHLRGLVSARVVGNSTHSLTVVYDRSGASEYTNVLGISTCVFPVPGDVTVATYAGDPFAFSNPDYQDRFEILRRGQWTFSADKRLAFEVEWFIPLNGRRINFSRPPTLARPIDFGGVYLLWGSNVMAPNGPSCVLHTRLLFRQPK